MRPRGYVCGNCGEGGHNSRTCARNSIPGQRECRVCSERKCLSEFSRQPCGRQGRHSCCKACTAKRRQGQSHKDWTRNWYLRRDFGISLDNYKQVLSAQGGVCILCGGRNKSGWDLAVDHCHASGKIRGLLCSSCNTGLGMFKDSPDLCERAAEYLRRSRIFAA